jgi:hypothetical protein
MKKLASTTRAPAWLALLVPACGNQQEVEAHRLIGSADAAQASSGSCCVKLKALHRSHPKAGDVP